ncbi:CBS domain-containing protein [Robiginitalea marina]|uniref:CBS domain-containing protein n=1 Tax=Robiginitalea marina TaxID=2954105 RepID=A0ABT1AWA0_9FLAO|nr:CBS domain-containing protein [Robiginitalea marina]MCO5723900.1 CBS domain-containing protein [Robiginitalea marina]
MIPSRNYQSAREMMSKNIIFIDGLATAKEAVDLMRQEKVDALIVKKRNENDAFGIVTIRDLINGVIIPDRTSQEVNVFEIMVKPTITVPADMDVRYVARLFIRLDIWEAPVEENGSLIGMISLSTIILNNVLF